MSPAKTKTSGRPRNGLVLALSILPALVCACDVREGPTDGETHFLRMCDPDGDDCGSDLSCVCGVCVRPCAEITECEGLGEPAECIANSKRPLAAACSEASAASYCDVLCTRDADCSTVSPSLKCFGGFCRESAEPLAGGAGGAGKTAPTGGADARGGAGGAIGAGGDGGKDAAGAPDTTGGGGVSGAGGSAEGGAGGAAGAGQPGACPHGEVAAEDVVILGDIFLATDHQIVSDLQQLARDAGALGADESYRDYSSMTENGLTTEGALLADRYAAAIAESPIQVVIMDGGGADILIPSCDGEPTADCPVMVEAAAAADELLAQMAADGVEDVLWFYYPDPEDETRLAYLNVLRPLLKDACDGSAVSCHWLELQDTFAGQYGDYMQSDFQTTAEGAQVAASAIWAKMQLDCLAQ